MNQKKTKSKLAIEDVPTVLRVARQKAALGMYKESIKTYKHALHALSTHIKQLSDPCLKEQWKKTNDDVKDEVSSVYKIYKAIKKFHGKELKRESVSADDEAKPVPQNVIDHFGGQPFKGKEKSVIKEEKKEEVKKDPMVWDPASPRIKKSVKLPSKSAPRKPPIKKSKPTTA